MLTVITRAEVKEKDQIRLYCWDWLARACGVHSFNGTAMLKVCDIKERQTFKILEGPFQVYSDVKFYKNKVKIEMQSSHDIPCEMSTYPENVPPPTVSGSISYLNILGKLHQTTPVKTKVIGGKDVRFRQLCLQSFSDGLNVKEAHAWVEVDDNCFFYDKLESVAEKTSVLVTEVKVRAYASSNGLRNALSMTKHSQIIPTQSSDEADSATKQSREIVEAFKEAEDSPHRRRALKRLLSEAENEDASRPTIRQKLDKLKVKGAEVSDDEAGEKEKGSDASDQE